MKLLVTGAAGFIGNTYVAQRVAAGDEVVVVDALTYAGFRENLDWITPKERWRLVVGDIADAARVRRLFAEFEPDALVHFAAESHVDNSINGPAVFIKTNVEGTFVLLEAAREYWGRLKGKKKAAFRYLQISTDEVYGSLGKEGMFTEESPMRPNSPYSASKAAADHLVRAWHHTYDLPVLITNCTNNYGPRQYPEKLIPRMIINALTGRELPIYGDGSNVRDWIHVEDHCRGVHLALEKGVPGETYAFSGHAEKSNRETVEAICAEMDRVRPREDGKSYTEQIAFVKDRPGHDWRYAINDSKAMQELGFTHAYTSFEQGLAATVAWYLENPEWCASVLGEPVALAGNGD